ncbi:serine protein kinase [Microdochium trichocladiopsis]|uniref:EKC/KEOPS complex subunit BUD32 n=1 Tax=Microdochium trichocladiopsis TaxID=1682393 RepID=A0A9P9BXD6_9PEZI|nr:serine protein kinase [Microdochium trichocladiopsis]KAH7041490.1 serine protein kinase [Microdochium trichocladiopsis]
MAAPGPYTCGFPVEPLDRYETGGYHPVRLGDTFSQGRYGVLHKLGWGGYSTTWLARDGLENRNVALKVSSADATIKKGPGEKEILQILSALPKSHSGNAHIVSLLDSFMVNGPNGAHSCLVLELLGPSVYETNLNAFMNYAFPASLAKKTAAQVLSGIDLMSRHGIGHGDLSTNNLVFKIPEIDRLQERELLQLYSDPETTPVKREGGGPIGDEVPPYLVDPAEISHGMVKRALSTDPCVKIIDFGEAFLDEDRPLKLNTAITVRAPEIIFGDELDCRVDLWAMGCMLFELAAAQPLFEATSEKGIVAQMLGMSPDRRLPPRWQDNWHAMLSTGNSNVGDYLDWTLDKWLEETYSFHAPETTSATTTEDLFSKNDFADICRLMRKLMKFEPGERAEAIEILEDPWFRDSKLQSRCEDC